MNLHRVTLKGMTSSSLSTAYGNPYVLAEDPTEALKKVQDYVNKHNLGFSHDRVLDKIELLAESGSYPSCNIQLYL